MTAPTAENDLDDECAAMQALVDKLAADFARIVEFREKCRQIDRDTKAFWDKIDKCTPARPIGSGGGISAGANSAGRGP